MVNKVCFFTNTIYMPGGAERVICTLASDFAARGIDITIITQESAECGYPLDPRVKVVATKVSCKIPGLRLFVRSLRLRKVIKELAPDAAISFMAANNLILTVFTLGLPCARIGSDRIYPKMLKGFQTKLCPVIYPLTDGFVFQTEEAKNCFGGKFRERSKVIANPLVGNIPPRAEQITKDIVTVGRLTAQKNHDLLIRAFHKFHEVHPDYTLRIYGDGERKAHLQALIDSLGLADCVFLMGTSKTVLQDIAAAKMFVMTSDYEGMPNALAEAIALGIPSISTDCLGGGAAALIQDGANGILIPVNDEEKLVDAMNVLAEDDSLAKRLGERGMELKQRLSVDTISQQWLDYIALTIANKKQK